MPWRVLAVAIALSVFKPKGRTPFGRPAGDMAPTWEWTPMAYAFWVTLIVLLATSIVRHIAGGNSHH